MFAAILFLQLLAAPAPGYEQPVAVMPFKNLNSETTLDWLKAGIAETMVSDLRKTGNVRVVERDQVDRAMSEIALQGVKASEESNAARVGKLVGAKTIVIGSFQQADKQVRINARFVAVETGVVLDTAKTTGPIEKIFALQDEVVDRLLGATAAAPKPKSRPVRKETTKGVEAYKLYAMSLGTASDADKIDYLKRSLEQDPEFSYAIDDLAALEKRLGVYRKARESGMGDQDAALWARIADEKLPPLERAMGVKHLLTIRLDDRRFRALAADAQKILAMKLPAPPPGTVDPPHDYATFCLFEAQRNLRKRKEAVQTAERYLEKFPNGFSYSEVEEGVAELIEEQRHRKANETFFAERLAKTEKERESEKKKLTGDALAERMRQLDSYRCDMLWQMHSVAYDLNLKECRAFIEKYRSDPSPGARDSTLGARRVEVIALAELGEFEKAAELARALMKDDPDGKRGPFYNHMKELLEDEWPKDVVAP